jgi:hypothetical protein
MNIEVEPHRPDYLWRTFKNGLMLSISFIYLPQELSLLGTMVEGILGILRKDWTELYVTKLGF